MQQVRATSTATHTPLEIELLRAVVEAGDIRASDLAGQLLVTKTSISRYVKGMLDEGLLIQRPDPRDGRATLLSVSASGRKEFEVREARRSALLHQICHDWTQSEVRTLTDLLQRLNDGVHEAVTSSTPRP
jgi:DNA-binding MarR family transcriptional regulator